MQWIILLYILSIWTQEILKLIETIESLNTSQGALIILFL